jgi:glucose-1-phosphate thymidylyltransferase
MNIIIPMAGMGKRMRPHTLTTPKPLLKIAGKEIVKILCEEIVRTCEGKVENIGFIIGDFGDKVEEDLIKVAQELGSTGKIYHQEEALGTAHAIYCAEELLQGNTVIAFADTLFDAGFKMDLNQDGIIWTSCVKDPSQFGVVKKKEDGTIEKFVEKPAEFVSNEAIIGIYYFKKGEELKKEIKYLLDNNIMKSNEYQLTDALDNMLNKGFKFKTQKVKEWLDCGNKKATVYTNQRILDLRQHSTIDVKNSTFKNSIIISPCFIDDDVVLENSIVGPYVSISKNTNLNDVIVKNSIIGGNSNISDIIVKDSIIGNNVSIKSERYDFSVGDYNEIEL